MIELKSTQANITLKSPTVVSGSVDLSNYYTKAQVDALIPDVSGFALKTDIPDVSGYALKSEIPDVSGFITEIPAEYVTDSELAAKGYLTEHQSLADYSTTTQVQSMIDTAIAGITDGDKISY